MLTDILHRHELPSFLKLSSGSAAQSIVITEFPLASVDGPWEIATGPDGALWFTENNANKIGRITTAGALTEYPVPTLNSGPLGIAAGPDGALWFTEEAASKIGRITTAGAISEYPLPTSGGQTGGIAAGPDGALWFTEQNANQIGRITTAGGITEYLIPTANSHPLSIAAGPDGALWFTEEIGNQIGRITTAGALREYAVPNSGSFPFKIAAGPDGALWFTETLANQIGRITTAGVISGYAIPTAVSNPLGIAAGPNNTLWFTEQAANQIARITTGGVFSEYTVPTSSSYPAGIVAGPDGAMWFTEDSAGQIGRAGLVPSLGLTKTHAAGFTQGQANAQYTLTVSNSGAGTTSGTVTVTDNLPSGLTLVSMSGAGWICSAFTCARNDPLPVNSGFPPVNVTVNVAANAPALVTNQATVSGGGSLPASASDPTNVVQACSYSFPGSPANVGSGTSQGSAGLVTSLTNCPYTNVVSNNPTWITITSGLSGGGSITIGYAVNALNSCGAPRVGSFTVFNGNLAVATFMIVQAAGACAVTSVTSSTPNGTYLTNQSVSIQVSFNGVVTVTGVPQLALNSGGTATYSSGSGSATLNFAYTVGGTDNSAHLDYASTSALTLNGGTIKDASMAAAILTLPAAGAPGSLGANTSIVIGGTAAPPGFFTGQILLTGGVYYLQFPNGNLFGYYSFPSFPILFHYDLGFEAFIDGGNGAAYLYDFATLHWFYTSSSLFPFLYDFTLSSWLYYFPDPNNPGHYTTNPRYFSNLATGNVFTM